MTTAWNEESRTVGGNIREFNNGRCAERQEDSEYKTRVEYEDLTQANLDRLRAPFVWTPTEAVYGSMVHWLKIGTDIEVSWLCGATGCFGHWQRALQNRWRTPSPDRDCRGRATVILDGICIFSRQKYDVLGILNQMSSHVVVPDRSSDRDSIGAAFILAADQPLTRFGSRS